eukprot:2809752-Rhodomonas_salina.2
MRRVVLSLRIVVLTLSDTQWTVLREAPTSLDSVISHVLFGHKIVGFLTAGSEGCEIKRERFVLSTVCSTVQREPVLVLFGHKIVGLHRLPLHTLLSRNAEQGPRDPTP